MSRPRLLDLFCCAGGAAMGYHQAGFDVVGVDVKPQPRYPFEFIQGDALALDQAFIAGFDAVHASPPCQAYSEATPLEARKDHPRLIERTRELLRDHPLWVIENVEGARHHLREPFMLCGTMFGLNLWRHRFFEAPALPLFLLPSCDHLGHPVVISGSAHGRGEAKVPEMLVAMETPWMEVRSAVRQAIPPAYTRFIGEQLLSVIEQQRLAA